MSSVQMQPTNKQRILSGPDSPKIEIVIEPMVSKEEPTMLPPPVTAKATATALASKPKKPVAPTLEINANVHTSGFNAFSKSVMVICGNAQCEVCLEKMNQLLQRNHKGTKKRYNKTERNFPVIPQRRRTNSLPNSPNSGPFSHMYKSQSQHALTSPSVSETTISPLLTSSNSSNSGQNSEQKVGQPRMLETPEEIKAADEIIKQSTLFRGATFPERKEKTLCQSLSKSLFGPTAGMMFSTWQTLAVLTCSFFTLQEQVDPVVNAFTIFALSFFLLSCIIKWIVSCFVFFCNTDSRCIERGYLSAIANDICGGPCLLWEDPEGNPFKPSFGPYALDFFLRYLPWVLITFYIYDSDLAINLGPWIAVSVCSVACFVQRSVQFAVFR